MSAAFLVGIGGCCGALARYALDVAISRRVDSEFPFATLAINVVAAATAGALFALLANRSGQDEWARTVLGVGFLASFSTFSTMTVETVVLAENGRLGLAGAYLLASVGIGLVATIAGFGIVRALS